MGESVQAIKSSQDWDDQDMLENHTAFIKACGLEQEFLKFLQSKADSEDDTEVYESKT